MLEDARLLFDIALGFELGAGLPFGPDAAVGQVLAQFEQQGSVGDKPLGSQVGSYSSAGW